MGLGDPYRTQDAPVVYACEVTMGSGQPMAILRKTLLGAISNAMTVAGAVVKSQGQVTWV